MAQRERRAHRVAVVVSEVAYIPDEGGALLYVVVLHMPLARAFLRRKLRPPLGKDLPLAVCLSTDRVVARDEPDGEDASVLELRIVAAARREVDLRRLPPAADLHAVVRRGLRIPRERVTRIAASSEVVVRGPEIEVGEVDRVVSERVDAADAFEQRHTGPRAFSKFVGVVMEKPIGVEFTRELRLASKQALPRELTRAGR